MAKMTKVKFDCREGKKVARTPWGVNLRAPFTDTVEADSNKIISLGVTCDRPLLVWLTERFAGELPRTTRGPATVRHPGDAQEITRTRPAIYAPGSVISVLVVNPTAARITIDDGIAILEAAVLDGSGYEVEGA